MIGKFKLKKVDNSTGKEEVVFEDSNQVTDGFRHAIVNVLTSTGSNDVRDYAFGYFQLGTDNYDLSNYAISGDLTSSSFRSHFWTLKSPMTAEQYGRDSKIPVVSRNTYVMGSVYPSGTGATKVLDNFVEPPETRTVINEYTNAPYTQIDGVEELGDLSSIWTCGCADTYQLDPDNERLNPMPYTLDYSMSGPDFATPSFSYSMTDKRDLDGAAITSICIRTNHGYVYKNAINSEHHDSGKQMTVWTKLRNSQTFSTHYAGKHYTSGTPEVSGSLGTGRVQIFNRFAQSLIATVAGQNRMNFAYRYGWDNSAATYTPEMIEVSSGWDNYKNSTSEASAVAKFTDAFGVSSREDYGIVSANIYNRAGAVYTYNDVSTGVPTARSGPGAALWDVSNAGFGPSGNFYRTSITWTDAADSMINLDFKSGNSIIQGCGLVPMHFPIVNVVSAIDASRGEVVYHSDDAGFFETTPRAKAWVGFSQYEHRDYASPVQNIHGEQSYYLTYPQKLLEVQEGHTTNLLDNTTNVRLNVDNSLANSQTIKEVGIFLKNPGGYGGQDVPYLAAYKWLPCPIEKNSEFSYLIDWEFSMADDSVDQATQADPEAC